MDFTGIEKAVYGNRNLEEDEELLAELMALEQEEKKAQGAQPVARPTQPVRQNPMPAPVGVDPAVMAAALADASSHPEQVEDDEALLRELSDLVGDEEPSRRVQPPVPARGSSITTAPQPSGNQPSSTTENSRTDYYRQLLVVYEKMKADSEKENNANKTKRLHRTVNRLKEIVLKSSRGETIDESDVPPAPPNWQPTNTVSTPAQPAPARKAPALPPRTPEPVSHEQQAPPVPTTKMSSPPAGKPASQSTAGEITDIRALLTRRRNAFVANGKAAVAAQDKDAAMNFVQMSKMFDQAIAALESASADDLNLDDIPRTPPPYRKKELPKTFMEGLEFRMKRYKDSADAAKQAGNERKARMNMRMVAQYQEAIRNARSGVAVKVEELPSLPDMPPLPPQTSGKTPATVPVAARTGPPPGVHPPPAVGPLAPSGSDDVSRNSSQLQFLLQRQLQFKQAAIHAKSHGNIEMARKYLLESKGFDRMISAARAGLPVSIKDTPIPPQAATAPTTLQPKIVASSSSVTGVEGRGEVLSMLENALIEQIQLAENNRMRFTRLGDVGKVKLFESWAKVSKQDLLLVRAVAKQNLKLPRFHYENRQIPSADLFPELAEDVLELSINSCKNVPLPSGYEPHHANIFVRYTFPYPDTTQTGKTKHLSGTTSPEFSEVFIIQIGSKKARGQKLCRVLKRNPLKLEVYQKGSFLRSDKLMGTCEWKLDGLESKAEMEESLPLKEGRKAVGGLLSLRIRIREPLGDSKMHITSHKWVVLDS